MITERTKAHGLGYIDPGKMQQTLALLQKYQGISDTLKADELYNNKLLEKIGVE
jgi:hypothetical protein